ncbi:hypothetical protein [Diaphorobacter aerolatus]|uniref:Uncharacterized protein n=1 Tax=Diaphorobacter aerolatus TaxID=1288495 RepID=A0A7H0GKU2_9BURK|nr:hypothetical protein [Diaphorobacter aerolatus]QNP48908.1 hypothetical protein H9K75_01510 [Diaphorobacter aerolatus]
MSIVMKSIQDVPKGIQMVHRADKHSSQWSMPASSGRSAFFCTFLMHAEKSENIVCTLNIKSDFWKRGIINHESVMVNDINVELSQVLLNPKAIQMLQIKMNKWLEGGVFLRLRLAQLERAIRS